MTPEEKRKLNEVYAFMKSFSSENTIPLDVGRSLKSRLFPFIFGIATLSGGKFDVADGRISSTSKGIAMRMNSSSFFTLATANLSTGFLAPNIMRIFEGTFTENYDICYFIIP